MERGSSLGRAYQLFHLPSPYQITRFSHLARRSLASSTQQSSIRIRPSFAVTSTQNHLLIAPKSPVTSPICASVKHPYLAPDFVSGKQRIIVIKRSASIVIFTPIFTQLYLDRRITASQKRRRNAKNALFLLIFT